MKFGFFTLGPVPKPVDADTWPDGQEHARFQEWLEQASIADELGYDYWFVGEHHFQTEYTHMTSPEVFMGAASQRTRNIRLGTALMHIGRYHNHPIEVAEQVGTLDLVSNGRWEFGSGPAAPWDGNGVYGVEGEIEQATTSSSALWEEGLRECVRMMTEEPYGGVKGGLFDEIPSITVSPRPLQKPHPPLWRSAVQPGSYARCSKLGVGALMLAAFGHDAVRAGVEEYWNAFREGVTPIGAAINPSIAAFIHLHCAPTDEAAQARGRAGIDFFSYGIFNSASDVRFERHNLNRSFVELRDAGGVSTLPFNFGATAMIGSPATIREQLRAIEATNVDVVNFVVTTGATEHEHIVETMELMAREVLPEFRERHGEHERWRAAQLDGCRHAINATV